ncbi:hypothetical protein K503DRAFT_786578 [Rhizopogon vinicolor AM-OR11-026]|uniref:Uncharacterized protein n=1 Tax=Rhizopogon vinicolor AM-OR11-026 TaxID=1314800 RepID=A0A1B7ML37_9AGAM|nr:hypothetical protein K503DRAFT_786578 [Rhizopogon vinicolor AM-OR11-026]
MQDMIEVLITHLPFCATFSRSSNSRAKFARGPDLFNTAYFGEVDIDGERIRQLPEDNVPEELLGVRQYTDSGVVDQESEDYLPEEEDTGDQSTLNELPDVIPLQAEGSIDTDLVNIS